MKPSESAPVEDLELLADAPLVTSRYQTWQPGDGVPIRSTVGWPRFWRHGPMWHNRDITPYGVFGQHLGEDQARTEYLKRLDRHAEAVVNGLAEVARQHPGEALVVMCFEDVHAGEVCHRRWFAEWFGRRFGIEVPELPARPASRGGLGGDGQLQLPL